MKPRKLKCGTGPRFEEFKSQAKQLFEAFYHFDLQLFSLEAWASLAAELTVRPGLKDGKTARHVQNMTWYSLDYVKDGCGSPYYWSLLPSVIESKKEWDSKAKKLVLDLLDVWRNDRTRHEVRSGREFTDNQAVHYLNLLRMVFESKQQEDCDLQTRVTELLDNWWSEQSRGDVASREEAHDTKAAKAIRPANLCDAMKMSTQWLFENGTHPAQMEEFAHFFKNLVEAWMSNGSRLEAEFVEAEAVAFKAEQLMFKAHQNLPKTGERHLQLAAAKDDLGWILKQQIIQDRVKATSDGAHTWEHCYTLFQSAYTQLELASAYTPKPLGLDQKRFDVLWNWIHGELTWGDTVKTHVPVAKARRDFGADSPFLKRLETDYWVGSAFLST